MNQIKVLSFLLALLAVNNLFKFTPGTPQFIYFGLMAIIAFLAITKTKIRVNFLIVWFLGACILSIVLNDIPSFFKVEQRFIIFLVGILCLSPLLSGSFIDAIKNTVFQYTNMLLVIITFFSFIGRVTGVYSVSGPGGFAGVTVHSMTMGVVGGLALLYIFFIYNNKTMTKKVRYMFILMGFLALFCVILAGSRGALLGTLIGVLLFVFKQYQANFTRSIKVFLLIGFGLFLTSPIWLQYTGTLVQKSERVDSKGEKSFTSSRDEIWEFRKKEFNESPVVGIGFASSKYGLINESTGQIEPGSNWGAIFAQIGIFGAIPFILLIWNHLTFLWRSNNSDSTFLLGLLGFFITHWFVEGYMLSAGAFEFFYSWLLLGVIQAEKKHLHTSIVYNTQTLKI